MEKEDVFNLYYFLYFFGGGKKTYFFLIQFFSPPGVLNHKGAQSFVNYLHKFIAAHYTLLHPLSVRVYQMQ